MADKCLQRLRLNVHFPLRLFLTMKTVVLRNAQHGFTEITGFVIFLVQGTSHR